MAPVARCRRDCGDRSARSACEACLRRLGEAEETVLALERVNKPLAPPAATNVVPFARRRLAVVAASRNGSRTARRHALAAGTTAAQCGDAGNGQRPLLSFAVRRNGPEGKGSLRTRPFVVLRYCRRDGTLRRLRRGGQQSRSLGPTNAAGPTSELFVKLKDALTTLNCEAAAALWKRRRFDSRLIAYAKVLWHVCE